MLPQTAWRASTSPLMDTEAVVLQATLPGYKSTMMEYHAACTACMRRIARCMAVALDLPPDYFDPHLTSPIASLRHMHYLPTISDPSKVCDTPGAGIDWLGHLQELCMPLSQI